MSKILKQPQAEAVYAAMCALNNVGGRVHIMTGIQRGGLQVLERLNQTIAVGYDLDDIGGGRVVESHRNQAAFAAAYGLDGKQPRAAVYTPGIGWQVQDSHGRRGNFETEAEALAY